MKNFLATAAALAAFASSALAEGYRCEVRGNGESFISSWLGIELKSGAATGTIYDAYIREVRGKPIEVKAKDRGKGRVRFVYTLHNVPANPRPISITYTIDLDSTANAVSVRGRIPNASNMIIGKGQCQTGPISFI